MANGLGIPMLVTYGDYPEQLPAFPIGIPMSSDAGIPMSSGPGMFFF